MRKTNVVKTLGIVLLLCIFSLICSNKVQASEASLSVTNCNVGENFTVTVNIPSDIAGFDGSINITYSNGTTSFIGNMAAMPKLDDEGKFTYIGNYTKSAKAEVAGQAVVTVSNFRMYSIDNSNANNTIPVNSVTTLSQTITISDPATQQPAPAPTPTNPGSTETPANNQPAAPVVLNFKENNETMYTNRRVNVRQNYGTDSNIIQTLAVGTEVIRTGISDGNKDGYSWSRISYNGITGYVITAALTSDAPVTEETPPEEPTEEQPEENPNEVSDENKTEIEKISEELGAIPEVGINIMPFMFLGSCIACMTLIIETKRKLNEQ